MTIWPSNPNLLKFALIWEAHRLMLEVQGMFLGETKHGTDTLKSGKATIIFVKKYPFRVGSIGTNEFSFIPVPCWVDRNERLFLYKNYRYRTTV